MNNIKVEIASPEHIKALEDFTRELAESLGQKFDPKRFDWGIRRRLFDPLQRHGILIAIEEDKNEPVGMIIAELRIDPFGLSEGYIKQFFLKEDYRRKGVREVLLQKALNHLKKIKVEKDKVNELLKDIDPSSFSKLNEIKLITKTVIDMVVSMNLSRLLLILLLAIENIGITIFRTGT